MAGPVLRVAATALLRSNRSRVALFASRAAVSLHASEKRPTRPATIDTKYISFRFIELGMIPVLVATRPTAGSEGRQCWNSSCQRSRSMRRQQPRRQLRFRCDRPWEMTKRRARGPDQGNASDPARGLDQGSASNPARRIDQSSPTMLPTAPVPEESIKTAQRFRQQSLAPEDSIKAISPTIQLSIPAAEM